ncbi:hypothetical protein HED50_02520 [Ochrobactrum oryzae]|uniref:hypothetical protein n=1 Tax=Brucella oryzae TaxID=335286 RepID=UPI0011B00F60|nr:hypothetical protein [Brucella oryzae]NKC21925.1 hypothetical protein [Brucella oryzae]
MSRKIFCRMQPKRDEVRPDDALLPGYLCFSAQDFILIICHATIADETKAGRFSAAVGNPAYRKRRSEQSWQQDATYGYSFGSRKAKHTEYNN